MEDQRYVNTMQKALRGSRWPLDNHNNVMRDAECIHVGLVGIMDALNTKYI